MTRNRMFFDCSERLKRAIKVRAAKKGLEPSDVIASILEPELAPELELADQELASEESSGDKPTRTRRKSK